METYKLADPAPTPPPQAPSAETAPLPKKKFPRPLLIGGIVLGFILFFIIGMLIGSAGKNSSQTGVAAPTEIPTPTTRAVPSETTPGTVTGAIQYLPGKQYYDDSIAIITKTEPRQVLLVSISRFGQEKGFMQYAKVNYFSGTAWLRDNVTTTITQPAIVNNPLISRFTLTPPISTTSQQSTNLNVTIENRPLALTIQKMGYDVSTQAYPGYTKVNYFGEGTLRTADDTYPAYVLYTQTFALNAADVAFLGTPEQLESDWLVFWDEQGNAYYLDNLASASRNSPYANYQTGIIYGSDEKTAKVGKPQFRPSQNNQYTATFPLATQSRITFAVSNLLNKAPVKTYRWQTGIASGLVQTGQTQTNGIGIIEMIHKN